MSAAPVAATKPPVTLIDLSAIFWTAWHSSGGEAVSQAKARTLGGVAKCSDPGALVAVCCDSGRSFRKDLHPDYKANRPEKDQAVIGELERVIETLRARGYLIWQVPTFEADDVIATATRLALAAGHSVVICSADKDLVQLAGPGVDFFKTNTWARVTGSEAASAFGVMPSQLGDWLALVGDKSDNIAGAPGIGPKKATDLLVQWKTLSGIWSALEKERPAIESLIGPACTAKLAGAIDDVCKARQLVGLRSDVPLKWDEIYETRRSKPAEGETMPDVPQDETEEKTPVPEVVPPANGNGTPTAPAPAVKAEVVESRALVPAVAYERGLEPKGLAQAKWLAEMMMDSRMYSRFSTPAAIMAVIVRGREMGLGAMTALDTFHVIEGKPAPHAYLIIARAKQDTDCEYFMCTESTPERATWETKNRRNPRPTTITYTIEQARRAGLTSGNWTKRPDEMLRKTAGVQLARMEYPDAALGLYAVEELGGEA